MLNLPIRISVRPPSGGRPAPPPPVIGSASADAITLGRLVTSAGIGEKIRYGGDQHALLIGANGKGKATRILVPNLLQMTGNKSIVVVDPKGELAALTAPFRRTLGRVVIINPFGVLCDWPGYEDLASCGFNPLAALDPAARSFNSRASLLAEALVTVDPKDPHWGTSARALVAALLMYTVIEARRAGRTPAMARFRELLCMASSDGDPARGIPPTGIPALAEQMMRAGLAGLRNKAAQFTSWNREIQSVASTARIQTESFDDDEIAADLARDGFDFRDLRRGPVTVYFILPPEMMERHAKWIRLILTSAIQSVLSVRKPGESKVLFMLDEFYALGRLDIISTVWALTRGYGIQILPVLQGLGQLKELYPDTWEIFLGMAGAVLSFGPNDLTTAEWLSRRAGETARTFTTYNSSSSTGTNTGAGPSGASSGSSTGFSESLNTSQMRAPLLTAHKLFGLPPGFMLLTLDGLSDVVPVYAPPYYDIRQCMARAVRANPYYMPEGMHPY